MCLAMPSKFRLRRVFRPIINALAKLFKKIGMTPNIATLFVLILACLSFVFLVFYQNLLLFSVFVFLTGLFDGIDGQIARLNNTSSNYGGFIDSITDRLSEFVIYLGLLLYLNESSLWGILDMKIIVIMCLIGSIMISYLRARAEVFFKGDFDFGLMARSERLFYIFIVSLVSNFFGFVNEFLFFFMFLVIGTAVFRYYKIRKIIREFEISS
jgi:archaetidylinositol phosphate synthase